MSSPVSTFPFRRAYVDSNFGQLHVTMPAEDRNGRTPLILLSSRSHSFRKLFPLVESSHYPLIVDVPGMGGSSAPPVGATMYDVADCLAEFMDREGLCTVDMVGVHTGHKVAAAFAARSPERVRRLVIAGKTHSLIPETSKRNAAMQKQLDTDPPDVAVVRSEGRYIDDPHWQIGFSRIFEANFAYDFEAALRNVRAETLVLEFTTPREDSLYGRQAGEVTDCLQAAMAIAIPETDCTGIDLYIGPATFADLMLSFFSRGLTFRA